MESLITTRCRGCLSTDRKLSLLSGSTKKCFLQILSEISSVQSENQYVYLCWECNAYVTRIVKFKDTVKQADEGIKIQSRLQHQQLSSLSYNPEQSETEDACELVLPDTNISDKSDDEILEVKKEKKKKVKKRKRIKNEPQESKIYTKLTLDKDGIQKEREALLQKDDYINSIYKCDKCIKTFPNAEDMEEHETNKHLKETPYKCAICLCHLNTEVSYNYHTHTHTTRLQCNTCLLNFVTRRDVMKHYNDVHCYGSNLIYKRSNRSVTNGDKVIAESDDGTTQEFGCEFCNKSFKWKTSLRKHLETHRIESGLKRKPYCETCKLTFTTTANLQKHVKTSSKHQIQLKLRKLKHLPSEAQKSREQITVEVNSLVARHGCEACGKTFQWRGNLLRHLYSHDARTKGELVCKPCDRTFSSIATYKQHLKISKKHVSENDFKYMCSECGRRFFNRTRLKEHVANVHERTFAENKKTNANKPALCHYCGKQAPNQAKLRTHIKAVHSQGSPFVCNICYSTFSWHSCLSRHLRRAHGNTKE